MPAKPQASLRKPPAPVPLEAAESFVSGSPDVSTSKRSSVKKGKGPGRGEIVRVKDGRIVRRLTIYLPADLAKKLAVHCAQRGEDLSDVVTEAVSKRLG
jgi:hypothetical protein